MKRKKFSIRGTGSQIKSEPQNKVLLECSKCHKDVECYDDVKSVICHVCMCNACPVPKKIVSVVSSVIKPKGWHFMKEFVDSEGNVYNQGVIQPSLKGTKQPTDINAIKSAQKERRLDKKNKLEKRKQRQIEKRKKIKDKEKKKKINILKNLVAQN